MKRLGLIFIISFLLNAVWENIHSLLYVHYMGNKITEFILLRATLADAIMITVIAAPFLFIPILKRHQWLLYIILIAVAISIEIYALGTGRWMYSEHMPLIPIFAVGLTPTIQLALLAYLSLKIEHRLHTTDSRD